MMAVPVAIPSSMGMSEKSPTDADTDSDIENKKQLGNVLPKLCNVVLRSIW